MLTTVPDDPPTRQEAALLWSARAAIALVLVLSFVNWVGWATGAHSFTQGLASWPHMPPWSAAIQAALAVSILVQLGRPAPPVAWAGISLATVAGFVAAAFVAEHATGRSFGLDRVFFFDAVGAVHETWPGRPSMWTGLSAALLAVAVVLIRLDHRWTRAAWFTSLAAAVVLPNITVLTYWFEAVSLMDASRSSGQAVASALSLLLLATATFLARPERGPLAWLLARPDRWTLIRLVAILAGLPIAIGLSRPVYLAAHLRGDAVWVVSIATATLVVGFAVFFTSQREHRLLIEKESLSRARAEAESRRADAERELARAESQRAEVEARYRILADNAVDVVVQISDDLRVVWTSPSLTAAFGDSPGQWLGSDFLAHIHPDDVDKFAVDLQEIASKQQVIASRFRVRTVDGRYHWVEGHGKPYVNAQGNIDGIIGPMRVADDKVEAERKLKRLARFDTLTGLVNRAETLSRLESALTGSRTPGTQLGVLFCDIDRFKAVNDTWGHAIGDAVLLNVAERTSQCVRHGDTVGRAGGDEIIVLLPGLKSLDEASQIAEEIRVRNAEPIHQSGNTIHVTISIGATLAIPGESPAELTARADAAMYQSKHGGRNRVTTI